MRHIYTVSDFREHMAAAFDEAEQGPVEISRNGVRYELRKVKQDSRSPLDVPSVKLGRQPSPGSILDDIESGRDR